MPVPATRLTSPYRALEPAAVIAWTPRWTWSARVLDGDEPIVPTLDTSLVFEPKLIASRHSYVFEEVATGTQPDCAAMSRSGLIPPIDVTVPRMRPMVERR